MSPPRHIFSIVILLLFAFSAACSPASAYNAGSAQNPLSTSVERTLTSTNIGIQPPGGKSTSSPLPPLPTKNSLGIAKCQMGKNPLAGLSGASINACVTAFQFPLSRPIQPPANDKVEQSYRYGSTQNGQREPHHGVEFINPAGTPVLAAAHGLVVVAGTDDETAYADEVNFYGRLVVIRHDVPGLGQPLFTLYGHLLKVVVEPGDKVEAGHQIGEVGVGGVAAGTHLHFEVRLGENSYLTTRNPELWLEPRQDDGGQPRGALAGRILDSQGNFLAIDNIVIKALSDSGQVVSNNYLKTYEDLKMVGLDPWNESFALSDLPAGQYRISFIYRHPQVYDVQVLPGQLTVITMLGE